MTEGAFPQANMRSINRACCRAIDKSIGSLGVATIRDLIETYRESLFIACARRCPAKKARERDGEDNEPGFLSRGDSWLHVRSTATVETLYM